MESSKYMHAALPPEGQENLTENPEILNQADDQEEQKMLDLLAELQAATTEEQLNAVMQKYLEGREN